MTVTATGRLSSTEPNLQNIPIRKSWVAKSEKCLWPRRAISSSMRTIARSNCVFLLIFSGDETMKKAFMSGEDIHR
jgi:DNA polymerase-1